MSTRITCLWTVNDSETLPWWGAGVSQNRSEHGLTIWVQVLQAHSADSSPKPGNQLENTAATQTSIPKLRPLLLGAEYPAESESDTGSWGAVAPCLPGAEPLPSRQRGSWCSTRGCELAPCWKSWPDLQFTPLPSPVTQTVAPRLSFFLWLLLECWCLNRSRERCLPRISFKGQGMPSNA